MTLANQLPSGARKARKFDFAEYPLRILCPQLCSDQANEANMVLLCCEILRQYRDQVFSPRNSDAGLIVEIPEHFELI